jgi:peptidoglycan-N-acetylglucosamine deacetylase
MMKSAAIKQKIKQSLTWVNLDGRLGDSVLLTFDDGPHPDVTPAVLRLLKEYNARAIFFVVGARLQRAPQLLKRILDDGHALGNHSYLHPNERQPWLGPYVKDLARCQESIKEITGKRPTLFRPPLGTFSPTALIAPRMLGLTTVLWSVDACDWGLKNREDAEEAAGRLAMKLETGSSRNDIVLMHDDNPHVVTILETILPRLASLGCDLYHGLDLIHQRPQR